MDLVANKTEETLVNKSVLVPTAIPSYMDDDDMQSFEDDLPSVNPLQLTIDRLTKSNAQLIHELDSWKKRFQTSETNFATYRIKIEAEKLELSQRCEVNMKQIVELETSLSEYETELYELNNTKKTLESSLEKSRSEFEEFRQQSEQKKAERERSERDESEIKKSSLSHSPVSDSVTLSVEPSSIATLGTNAEHERLLTRIKFLEDFSKMKEDQNEQLNGKIEDLKNERDSYKEAMVRIFEEQHPDQQQSRHSINSSNAGSGANNNTTSITNNNNNNYNGNASNGMLITTPSNISLADSSGVGSVLSNLSLSGNNVGLDDTFKYVGEVSGSLFGVIGNIGSSVISTSSSATSSGGGSHSTSVVIGLQEQVRELTQQLIDLKHLEKSKEKIEELERRAAQAEQYTQKAQEYCIAEVGAITEQLQLTHVKLNDSISQKEQIESELNKIKKQWTKDIKKLTALNSEITELKSQLQYTIKLVKDTEERLVDPIIVKNLEEKLNELSVEKTHWQKKAQSLSKDMLRVLGSATEAEELKGKLANLQSRVEELTSERDMFREAMVASISASNESSSNNSTGSGRRASFGISIAALDGLGSSMNKIGNSLGNLSSRASGGGIISPFSSPKR